MRRLQEVRMRKIGCCITSHGWGHAARTTAVVEQLGSLEPIEPVFVTQVPRFFFEESLGRPVTHHLLETDVGFVQISSLEEDIEQTRIALDAFYPLSPERVAACAELFHGCEAVICDIAPLGILAARELGVPSLLIENFTWDRMYESYLEACPKLQIHREYLQGVFAQADYHIQARPFCYPNRSDLIVHPVARALHGSAETIRKELSGTAYSSLVLLTMGGGGRGEIALDIVDGFPETLFLMPGYEHGVQPANVLALPVSSSYYHPDLVAAVDVVIGKVGYSTTAEVARAGKPFGYVDRPMFPESAYLIKYIAENMTGTAVSRKELREGTWTDQLDWLLRKSRQPCSFPAADGAETIARFLLDLCD